MTLHFSAFTDVDIIGSVWYLCLYRIYLH